MGRITVVPGQVVSASHMNLAVDQSVMVFASASARSSAIPAPVEGMVTYLQDLHRLEAWNGSAWSPEATGLLPLTGGTITDDLTISTGAGASSTLALNGTGTGYGEILWMRDAVLRWALQLVNTETGGNVGGDLWLSARADDGANLGAVLKLIRSTGLATVKADPTAALGIATKQYIDQRLPQTAAATGSGMTVPASRTQTAAVPTLTGPSAGTFLTTVHYSVVISPTAAGSIEVSVELLNGAGALISSYATRVAATGAGTLLSGQVAFPLSHVQKDVQAKAYITPGASCTVYADAGGHRLAVTHQRIA